MQLLLFMAALAACSGSEGSGGEERDGDGVEETDACCDLVDELDSEETEGTEADSDMSDSGESEGTDSNSDLDDIGDIEPVEVVKANGQTVGHLVGSEKTEEGIVVYTVHDSDRSVRFSINSETGFLAQSVTTRGFLREGAFGDCDGLPEQSYGTISLDQSNQWDACSELPIAETPTISVVDGEKWGRTEGEKACVIAPSATNTDDVWLYSVENVSIVCEKFSEENACIQFCFDRFQIEERFSLEMSQRLAVEVIPTQFELPITVAVE